MNLPAFQWHLPELAFFVVVLVAHHHAVHDAHQRRRIRWAVLAFALVTVWPIGDLASSVSLTVATVQRLVLMLLVAPLLLLGTPTAVLAKLTRPAPVDLVVRGLGSPVGSLLSVTLIGSLTLTVPVVDFGAHSSWGRALTLAVVVGIGLILWTPILGVVPGTRKLSPAARAGFTFFSALVVTSFSFVWIFSFHPLYPALHNQFRDLHMSALFDQQLAGFVAKIGCYVPMWIYAFQLFFRAEDEGVPVEETPLHWEDVERQLQRIDRSRQRRIRRHQPD